MGREVNAIGRRQGCTYRRRGKRLLPNHFVNAGPVPLSLREFGARRAIKGSKNQQQAIKALE
jgi:hypothetical protein